MFSCCFPRYRGSGCQKPQCAGLLRCWRGFLNPRWRCLRMFSRRSHKSHMPQMEENLNESPCSTSLKERRKPHAISTKPRWLRGTKVTRGDDNENCVRWTIDAGLLKQRVEHLVPAFLGRDPTYVSTFLGTYTTFTTTQKVLEVLFMRAISSILGTWMDHYPEEFFRPPDFTSLKLLRAYVRVHMPGSELQRRARLLYSWRKHPLAAALEPRPDVPRERAPAISVVPTATSQPRLPEATSSPGAQRVRESETLTAATPPGHEEWTNEGGWMLLEQRVEHLVPAFLGGDPSYLFTFLSTYRAFATTQQVLEILFMRYGCFHSEAEEDGGPREQEKRAISSILGTWMDHYPEEFFRPPDFTSLMLLRAYVRIHMPGSELQRRARLLYSWRKHPLVAALEPRPDVPRERAPAISVVPTAALQPRLPEATSSPGAKRVRESETLTAASPPGQEVLPALADSQELEEPPAPLVVLEHEQPSAPAGGVTEGLEQPPAAAEQPASAPQQRLMSAAAPQDEFPHLDIAFFVMLGLGIEIFSVLMYYWLTLNT
ncbi:ral guanine nucleotide dissociation stimulator-like isoform X2 [Felis catus]|uniref:ral guanine nucleotide dissociation stimulator-like isoform X2 n=1 Tax=Felis catus TaxID=9685 RepID=UPI001D19EDB2|nr:ral guanine nucleotide dissociation stimulator-like isoform X2 [Felis catus]